MYWYGAGLISPAIGIIPPSGPRTLIRFRSSTERRNCPSACTSLGPMVRNRDAYVATLREPVSEVGASDG